MADYFRTPNPWLTAAGALQGAADPLSKLFLEVPQIQAQIALEMRRMSNENEKMQLLRQQQESQGLLDAARTSLYDKEGDFYTERTATERDKRKQMQDLINNALNAGRAAYDRTRTAPTPRAMPQMFSTPTQSPFGLLQDILPSQPQMQPGNMSIADAINEALSREKQAYAYSTALDPAAAQRMFVPRPIGINARAYTGLGEEVGSPVYNLGPGEVLRNLEGEMLAEGRERLSSTRSEAAQHRLNLSSAVTGGALLPSQAETIFGPGTTNALQQVIRDALGVTNAPPVRQGKIHVQGPNGEKGWADADVPLPSGWKEIP